MNAMRPGTMPCGAAHRGTKRATPVVVMKWVMMCVVILAPTFAVLATIPASAQDQRRVPVDQATTEQKAAFLQRLVAKSVAAETIESSGDPAAMAKLEKARALVADANRDLNAGRYVVANGKLDQALNLINTEARRLSETELGRDRQREAYERRLHTVRAFLKAYERVAGEKGISVATTERLGDIRTLVAAAEAHAGGGRLKEAMALLDRAYVAERGGIRDAREGKTLTRSLNFASAEEEYDYERDRNESHFMLLRFAISEKQPPRTRRKRIDELREEAGVMRRRAEREAQDDHHDAAIGTLTASTDILLRAIRMTGLYIPG